MGKYFTQYPPRCVIKRKKTLGVVVLKNTEFWFNTKNGKKWRWREWRRRFPTETRYFRPLFPIIPSESG